MPGSSDAAAERAVKFCPICGARDKQHKVQFTDNGRVGSQHAIDIDCQHCQRNTVVYDSLSL